MKTEEKDTKRATSRITPQSTEDKQIALKTIKKKKSYTTTITMIHSVSYYKT